MLTALTLAAGGAVDEAGRAVPPAEPAAAKQLRRVLVDLADRLSGCTAGRSWNGDPVELIDAWQASPGLTGQRVASTLQALADEL